jgi:hypothetical protein
MAAQEHAVSARPEPYMTQRTCTDPSCDRLCGRTDHPAAPAPAYEEDGE